MDLHNYNNLLPRFHKRSDGVANDGDILREVGVAGVCAGAGKGDGDAGVGREGEVGDEGREAFGGVPGAGDEDDYGLFYGHVERGI